MSANLMPDSLLNSAVRPRTDQMQQFFAYIDICFGYVKISFSFMKRHRNESNDLFGLCQVVWI
jgi:hypothetical protein